MLHYVIHSFKSSFIQRLYIEPIYYIVLNGECSGLSSFISCVSSKLLNFLFLGASCGGVDEIRGEEQNWS